MAEVSLLSGETKNINWKILKQSDEGRLLATNAYVLLTSEYFSFSKTQCAVFKGNDRTMYTMKLKEKHVLDRKGSSQKGQWKILKAYKPRG